MAEALAAIGALASIGQLADFGFQLSIKLFAFGEAVANADRSVKSLSNEISLTAAVLRELSEVLGAETKHVSPRAVEAVEKTVQECFDVFEQLNRALEKSVGDLSSSKDGSERKKIKKFERVKWSFFQPRMDLLRSNLDRLKSSLTLMLQVLLYAQNVKKEQGVANLEYHKMTIESLARTSQVAEKKYQDLQRRIKDDVQPDNEPISRATTLVTRSATVSSHDELEILNTQTSTRSLDEDIEVQGYYPSTPANRPQSASSQNDKPLIGELILCFNLLHNILSYHLGVSSNASAYKTYITLRRAVEAAHETELDLLEKQYGDVAYEIGARASKNALLLQARLRALARRQSDHDGRYDDQEQEIAAPAKLNEEGRIAVSAPIPSRVSSRTATIQAEIDATVSTMRDSISKVGERGEKLDTLDDKTDQLAVSAAAFRRRAANTQSKSWVASTTKNLMSGVSTGAQAVAGSFSNAGSNVAAAFSQLSIPGNANQEANVKALDDLERYGLGIGKLEGLSFMLGGASSTIRHEHEEDEDEDNEDSGVVEQLLAQWTTFTE